MPLARRVGTPGVGRRGAAAWTGPDDPVFASLIVAAAELERDDDNNDVRAKRHPRRRAHAGWQPIERVLIESGLSSPSRRTPVQRIRPRLTDDCRFRLSCTPYLLPRVSATYLSHLLNKPIISSASSFILIYSYISSFQSVHFYKFLGKKIPEWVSWVLILCGKRRNIYRLEKNLKKL